MATFGETKAKTLKITPGTTKRSPSNIHGNYKQLTVQKKALVSADNNVSSRVISGLFYHTFIKTIRKKTARLRQAFNVRSKPVEK
jgi:hypothetical protein